MALPKATPAVGHAGRAELEHTPGNAYAVQILERLERENPCVAEFVSQMAIRHTDPVAVSTAALLVYRLLESQAEAEELKRTLTPPG